MKCGCKIELQEGFYFPTGIIYCPLHEAAPQMLEMLKSALAVGQVVGDSKQGVIEAIAKAERS